MSDPCIKRPITQRAVFGWNNKLKANGSFYGHNQRFREIPWKSAVDIDDDEDLAFAWAVANSLSS